jgi:hypothetical protein
MPLQAQYYGTAHRMADGTLLRAGHRNDVPLLVQFTGEWTEVKLPAELVPARGDLDGIGSDAQGNLYVAYTDESNPKKEVDGLLQRVGGTWSKLPPLPKGWSGVYSLCAASPEAVYFRSRSAETGKLVVQWDGKSYRSLPLPATVEEVGALHVDMDGDLIMGADAGSDAAVYTWTNESWQPMGQPLDGYYVDQLIQLSDWRLLCDVRSGGVYIWNGTAWESLPSLVLMEGQEVEEWCTGPDGRLYMTLENRVDKQTVQRLVCWQGDEVRYYHGTVEAAIQKNRLTELGCDAAGILRADAYSGGAVIGPDAFDWAADGYPQRDADAKNVLHHFKTDEPEYGQRTSMMFGLFGKYFTEQVPDDQFKLNNYWVTNLDPWLRDAQSRLDALGVAPGTNRLYDAYMELLRSTHATYHAMNEMSAQHRSGLGGDEARTKAMKDSEIAGARNLADLERIRAIQETYQGRNGL